MNDDRELRRASSRFLVLEGGPAQVNARVLSFNNARPRPLFAGWVGGDGNVVPFATPLKPKALVKKSLLDEEWI